MEQLQSFGFQNTTEETCARDIAAWSVEASNESYLDRVATGRKYDGYPGGSRLCSQGCSSAARGEDRGHISTHQICSKRRQPIGVPLRPAILDQNVSSFHVI